MRDRRDHARPVTPIETDRFRPQTGTSPTGRPSVVFITCSFDVPIRLASLSRCHSSRTCVCRLCSVAARSSLWSPPSSFSRPVSVPSVISPMPLLGDDAMRSINQSRPQSVRFEETKSSYRAGSDVPPRAMVENQSSAMATYAAMQSAQPFSR
mgnify:CR=1 FL=1